MIDLYVLCFGLLIGSFLNVVIYRYPLGESVVLPASHCPSCNHQIKPWENIPVVSYLFLRGKCSSCKTAISMRYPLVELITGVAFYSAYAKYDLSLSAVVFAFFAAILIAIAFIDLDHMIIPDLLIILGLIPGFYLWAIHGEQVLLSQIYGFFGMGLIFWGIRYFGALAFKREAMGFGDVKFAAMGGWVLGWDISIVSMFLAFLIATSLFTVLIPIGVITRKQQIPFGPFICMGIWFGLLFGAEIIDWYLNLFLGA